jgi:diaminohydroxyphosphoribosylaminopyrimidine deaminase/5-amino-6-(5-phosphoribosylamino)uracil reductase
MIINTNHEKYMQRCIDLAMQGLGKTAPNPLVGSVIVYNDKIIGEGYHRKYGESHAEVNAINSVKDKNLLKDSIIYVNLEPCSHYGKTPPCASLILGVGIPTIIIGSKDTASHVSGKGIELLKKNGCNVIIGVLDKECRDLNKRFFTFHEKNRPYIILKWAQTKDGFIDIERNEKSPNKPTWITNNIAKTLVHKWRTEEQSILIGTKTALADNPNLTSREWKGKNPLRIVFDRNFKLPMNLNIFNSDADTIIITDKPRKDVTDRHINPGIGIEFVEFNSGFHTQLFDILIKQNIQSVIVEGGGLVLDSFIKNDLWDEARIFQGEKVFGNGVKAPEMTVKEVKRTYIGNSKLTFVKKNE